MCGPGRATATALAALVWYHAFTIVATAELEEYLNSGCRNRTASTTLQPNTDLSEGQCSGPVDRHELTGSGGTFKLSFSMLCQEDDTVIYKMYMQSSSCSGKSVRATLSKSAADDLFAGNCVAFQPEIKGIPEMYMRLSHAKGLVKPCPEPTTTKAVVSAVPKEPKKGSDEREKAGGSSVKEKGGTSSDGDSLLLSPDIMEEGSQTSSTTPLLRPDTLVTEQTSTSEPPLTTISTTVAEISTTETKVEKTRKKKHTEAPTHHDTSKAREKEVTMSDEEQSSLAKINSAGAAAAVLAEPANAGTPTTTSESTTEATPKTTIAEETPEPSTTKAAPVVVETSDATSAPAGAEEKRGTGKRIPQLQLELDCNAFLANLTNTSSTSPFIAYTNSFNSWLRYMPQQAIIAGVAGSIGLLCAWDGPAIWHLLFTAIVAAIAAGVAYNEAKAFDMGWGFIAEVSLLVEVALVVSICVHMGFAGSQALFGCLVGFLGASHSAGLPKALDALLPGLALLWYSIGAVTGLLVFTVGRKYIVAALAPVLSGLLVASAFGFFMGVGMSGHDYAAAEFFPAADEAWIDAFLALLGPNGGAAMGLQCGFALVGLALHFWRKKVALAAACTVLGVFSASIAWFFGSGCGALSLSCPEDAPWKWMLVGSIIWALVAAGAVVKQLSTVSNLDHLDDRETVDLFDRVAGKDRKIEFKDFDFALRNGIIAPGAWSHGIQAWCLRLCMRDTRTHVPGYMKLPHVRVDKPPDVKQATVKTTTTTIHTGHY